jgi:hypothetical protein
MKDLLSIGIDELLVFIAALSAAIALLVKFREQTGALISKLFLGGLKAEIQQNHKEIANNRLCIQRIELLLLISVCPHNAIAIHDRYDKYKNDGGNSYMNGVFTEWEKQHADEKSAEASEK